MWEKAIIAPGRRCGGGGWSRSRRPARATVFFVLGCVFATAAAAEKELPKQREPEPPGAAKASSESQRAAKEAAQPPAIQLSPELLERARRELSRRGRAWPDAALRPGEKVNWGVDEALEAIEESSGEAERPREGEGVGAIPPQPVPPVPREGELSVFEIQLQVYADPLVGTPVRQFGYEVFAQPPSAPTDAPVGPDYVLGTGDNLILTVWGTAVDDDYRVTVDREGEVRLPQVGRVAVKGLTLKGAEDALRRRFDDVYTNYNLQLRVGRLRDIPVHVIGRVRRPGRVRVSSVATLFDALAAAGGVAKEGSLRKVVLRRRGEAPKSIDLYAYLIDGDIGVDVSLSANDVVLVPPVGARVAITGRVQRPAIYEIGGDEINFDTLLQMAGGYARLADRRRIDIESQGAEGLSVRTEDLRTAPPNQVRLRDGDVAIVRSASPKVENVVYVAGNVASPGRYAYREGMRVSDVLTDEALIEAGFWLRRGPPTAADAEAELPEPLLEYALIRRIDPRTRQEVRIAFHLGKAILEKDPAEDCSLLSQDTIMVFPRTAFASPDMVFVSGAVRQPNDYRFFPGMRVRDLVRMAGGLLPEAEVSGAILTRIYADQKGARYENIPIDLEGAMAGDERANIPLQRNDALSIRVVPEFRKPYRVTIEGEVKHPGTYTVIPGERLSDLLGRVGGLTKDAYLPGAQFYRESVRRLQEERLEQSLQQLELETKTAVQKFAAEAAAAGDASISVEAERTRIQELVQTIRRTPVRGRMVVRLRPPEELRGTSDDIELADGDRIAVPRVPEVVTVVGAVYNQTALLHRRGLRVRDYLAACGGTTDAAASHLLFVIRADGTADGAASAASGYRWDATRGRFARGSLLASEVFPGDTIVVPYDLEPKLSTLALAKTVTQIIFQAALATGVVVAIL